jgi:CheY-like chemotaxis protein
VETAASAREALPIVRAWLPNVILADVGMSGEDGYAFIRQVRSLAPQDGGLTPAVALTAYGGPDDRLRALSAGYQLHVAKPAMPSELAAAVAGLALSNSR